MKQHITIVRYGDRHSSLHERDFARSFEGEVPAGTLYRVLLHLTVKYALMKKLPPGRYVIYIDEPHD